MKLTVVFEDRVIGVDDVYINVGTISGVPADFRALQWYGTWGEVEFMRGFVDGKPFLKPNEIIYSLDGYQHLVDLYHVEKTRLIAGGSLAGEIPVVVFDQTHVPAA